MEFDPHHDVVFNLLTKLKTSGDGDYPPELLAARKARYLQQVAQVGIAAGTGMGIKEVLKGAKGPGIPPAVGTLLEVALVVAIVTEAGALGYFYRAKLADLLNISLTKPTAEENVNPPAVNSPVPQLELTVTPVGTGTATPSPVIVINGTVVPATEVVSPANTVGPVNSVDPVPTDKKGNQYGLTPLPERTKDPNGSTDSNNKDSSNKKP